MRLLASAPFARRIDWPRVHVFWGDERCVPPDEPESNYRMAREALLDHVPLPPTNIHRIRGEEEPSDAAAAYEEMLGGFFGSQRPRRGAVSISRSSAWVRMATPHRCFRAAPPPDETGRWVVASRWTASWQLARVADAGAAQCRRRRDVPGQRCGQGPTPERRARRPTAGRPSCAAHPADPRRAALDDR